MKIVVLLRHGHAAEGQDDHARPLTEEGHAAASEAAHALLRLGVKPDAVVSSTALRAVNTAEIAAQVLGYGGNVELRSDLYLASPERYAEAIQSLNDSVGTALLVAHNPGLGNLATACGHTGSMPPAGFYLLRQQVDAWANFEFDL